MNFAPMTKRIAAFCALGLMAGVVQAVPTIVNGSFEADPRPTAFPHKTTSLTGWTITGPETISINDQTGPFANNIPVPDGTLTINMQGQSGVNQNVAGFEAGKQYTLTYFEDARVQDPQNPNSFKVTLGTLELVAPHLVPAGAYIKKQVTFTSPGAGAFLLSFLNLIPTQGSPDFDNTVTIDAVSIVEGTPAPTPTPTPGPGGITPLSNWPFQAVQIPTGGTVPTIDGVLNPAEYEVTVPHYLALSSMTAVDPYIPSKTHTGGIFLTGANTTTTDADISFNLYFVWDATALYVAVQGVDDLSEPAAAGAGPNSGDTFQLDLAWDGVELNAEIPTYAIVTNTNDAANVRFKTFFTTNPFPGTTWAATVNGVNWTLETRIPWTAITNNGAVTYTKPIPPLPGQSARTMPMFGDRDNGNTAFLLSAGNGTNNIAASNAPNWNELFFLTEAIRPPNATQDWIMFQ